MINSPGPREFLPRRPGRKIVAMVAIVMLLFAVWSAFNGQWSFLHGFTLRGGVSVIQARLLSPDRLALNVAACNADPENSMLRETDVDVQVMVVASSWPFRGGGDDCDDIVEVQLQEPLGDRVLTDKHTGQPVSIKRAISVVGAELRSPNRLALGVDSCNRIPEMALQRETDIDVQVLVVASLAPFRGGGDDCQDIVELQLQKPLGDRVVVDMNTGQPVTVRRGVKVYEAELRSSNKLLLLVDSCRRNAEVSLLRETDVDVQVMVVDSPDPFGPGLECLEYREVQLQKPLGDRMVIDMHTGQPVSVSAAYSSSSTNHPGGEDPPAPDVAPPQINDPPNEAELQDLQGIAIQKGISLQEAIDRYAWNDNFSLLAAKIRGEFPAAFAGAEIVDTGHAWIAFAGPAPEEALDIIDLFSSSHSGVSVEVRTNLEFTELELQRAIEASHYAVFEAPEVRDATTSFDSATGQITTTVVLERTASDSVLDDLRAAATKAITDATRADILNSITYTVVHSNSQVLGGDD